MANLRSVNTKFWEDPWVETLLPEEKLLFLYLITNAYANIAGIYEISKKRICFETGLSNESVSNALKGFERIKKAYFVCDNYIFLPNWLKNQNLNGNMKKGVVNIIRELPKDVKINILGNDYQSLQNDYQSIRNTLLKYEILEVLEILEDEVLEYKSCESMDLSKYHKNAKEDVLKTIPEKFRCILKADWLANAYHDLVNVQKVDIKKEVLVEEAYHFINSCLLNGDVNRTQPDFISHFRNKIKKEHKNTAHNKDNSADVYKETKKKIEDLINSNKQ
jgi:hypothetical protein